MANALIEKYDAKTNKWEEMSIILPQAFDIFTHTAVSIEMKQSAKKLPSPFENGTTISNKILAIRFYKQNQCLPAIDLIDPF